ncbi:carbohydrate ABC transporter permease [Rhodomicrobium lacus]|uniref:carbohydrate ABC transporter permease n=1 Tax=Rhodomicrobium lacus TaxID=2498452 RepID=UPI000F8D0C7E|nr:carbohydrate ABC transporter permease [Rhodomicrobium lacus]
MAAKSVLIFRRSISAAGLFLVLLFFLLPIAYLGALSFKTRDEVLVGQFFTAHPTLDNWLKTFEFIDLTAFIWHSLLIAGASALLTLVITAPAVYAVAKLGRGGFVGQLTLASYVAPPVVSLLPLFFLMRITGLLNTVPGMIILYGVMNIPVAYWLLRGFVKQIPVELDEAAWTDGAGYIKTFVQINLPLLAPGLVATGLITLILAYNEFLFASVFAQDNAVRGLTVALSIFQGDRIVNFGQMAVASLAGILPVFIIAYAFQGRLIEGMTAGSIR